jgi:hypothetical protein
MGNMNGFNANEHEPGRDFDPIPNGKYPAQIVNSEQQDIGNGGSAGWKFVLQWKIMTGPHENRVIFQDILSGYNVQGEKGDKTRTIANQQMGDICRACGKPTPDDSSDLHFIPCEITVGLQKQNINPQTNQPYPPRNEVKSVKPSGGQQQRSAPSQGGQQSQPQTQQRQASTAASGGGWKRQAG